MKSITQKFIRFRNPTFQFDNELDNFMFLQFIGMQLWSLFRGFKMIFLLKNPKGMQLGKGTSFYYISKITWGKFLRIGNHVSVVALGKNGIEFGNSVSIGSFSNIVVSTSLNNLGAQIKVGNNVGIGEFAYLGGAGALSIGDECIVGQYFSCHPENHNFKDLSQSIRHQGVSRKGIHIGKNCWIGAKVTILDGVNIGDGCVIAAGSIVNKSFPSNSIIAGVPAQLINQRTHA
jgi:acetyltransferase-like isoleucine patch superfamily enzyme